MFAVSAVSIFFSNPFLFLTSSWIEKGIVPGGTKWFHFSFSVGFLFPEHHNDKSWYYSSTLLSKYKLYVRMYIYPTTVYTYECTYVHTYVCMHPHRLKPHSGITGLCTHSYVHTSQKQQQTFEARVFMYIRMYP